MARVHVEHLTDEVFEFFWKVAWISALFMNQPKQADFVDSKELVNTVILLSILLKRHASASHDKKDASKSKNINLISLVAFLGQKFWCHICKSAFISSLETGIISALERSCKAKINYFAIKVVV